MALAIGAAVDRRNHRQSTTVTAVSGGQKFLENPPLILCWGQRRRSCHSGARRPRRQASGDVRTVEARGWQQCGRGGI
ncbi:hypothetical protein EPI10_032342 [Gossypium australe]|uniref:Uncharacterized protein n=1 Tax=Gossypium australe TaxID=47621 RepID=A0A5B6X6T3_9ROSI|nr:hypothetical protein EPI10_032342 [Gossypium australe]